MTHSERRALWAERVATQAASGASAAAWCAAYDVPLPAFYSWRRRLAAPEPAVPRWVSVVPEAGPALTLRVGAVAIEVDPGFDPQLLAEVVRVLEAR